jgi:hypothetical protein
MDKWDLDPELASLFLALLATCLVVAGSFLPAPNGSNEIASLFAGAAARGLGTRDKEKY